MRQIYLKEYIDLSLLFKTKAFLDFSPVLCLQFIVYDDSISEVKTLLQKLHDVSGCRI